MEPFGASAHHVHVTGDRRMPLSASDESLLEASANGDQRAFSELYERHARAIYNFLFRRLADWSDAEDLTAVVFLEAFRRRSEVVVVEGKLLPWLYGIATNVLRNRGRALWRHRHLVAQLASQPGTDVTPDLAARAEAAEQMRSVLKRVARLPRQQQDVFALCVWSGLARPPWSSRSTPRLQSWPVDECPSRTSSYSLRKALAISSVTSLGTSSCG